MIPSGPYPPPTPNFTWLAWVIVGVVVSCLLIRFAASGGTMKRTKPADLKARRQRQAVIRAQSAARARARRARNTTNATRG